jgi:hypothetical protein
MGARTYLGLRAAGRGCSGRDGLSVIPLGVSGRSVFVRTATMWVPQVLWELAGRVRIDEGRVARLELEVFR